MEQCIHDRLEKLERDRALVAEELAGLRVDDPQPDPVERELRDLLAAMDAAEARLLAAA